MVEKRKSPIRHHVRQHKRTIDDGTTTVHDYMRGQGNAPPSVANPNLKHSTTSSDFTVIINYLDEAAKETLHIPADSYPSAIQQAMISRQSSSTPTVVEAIMN